MINEKYLKFVRQFPCIICYSNKVLTSSVEAHHENSSNRFYFSKRQFDYGAIPLCSKHHHERHFYGKQSFWNNLTPNFLYYTIIALLENYISYKNYQISQNTKNILESKTYKNFTEIELKNFVDILAEEIHKHIDILEDTRE